jgi:apolipoprotein N-acyltransferase
MHWLLLAASAALYIAAFPPVNQPWCAWVALVPWLRLLRRVSAAQAARFSFLLGTVVFLVTISWLLHVTIVGWIALSLVMALYWGIFGWAVNRWYALERQPPRRTRAGRALQAIGRGPWFIPAAWTAFEYIRAHLFSGFGWNLLAYSQASWVPVIQIAEVTGAWGLSFIIVAVNSLLEGELPDARPARRAGRWLAAAAALAVATVGYGWWRLPQIGRGPSVRVAVLQGNIPQHEKWDEKQQEPILRQYEELALRAADDEPDLIVWPETSAPDFFGLGETVTQRVIGLAETLQIPMLVGAPTAKLETMEWRNANSAVLISPDGDVLDQYDKLHLVPYGEYIPFEDLMPWIRAIAPPIGDFIPGGGYTVFHIPPAEGGKTVPPFSVLICFEDIFPELARTFVEGGAQWLLVITNDGWFGPTAAAIQHAQASTLRAVELRVPVARAANTGWSGCIDAAGRWTGQVQDAQGAALFVAGTHTCDLQVDGSETPYRRFGDWVPMVSCLLLGIGWPAAGVFRRRKR